MRLATRSGVTWPDRAPSDPRRSGSLGQAPTPLTYTFSVVGTGVDPVASLRLAESRTWPITWSSAVMGQVKPGLSPMVRYHR